MSIDNVRDRLSRAHTQSIMALSDRLKQNDDQQTFSATYLGGRSVQLANGDVRTADFHGTKQVAIGESVTVTFPLHSQIGFYTSKIS